MPLKLKKQEICVYSYLLIVQNLIIDNITFNCVLIDTLVILAQCFYRQFIRIQNIKTCSAVKPVLFICFLYALYIEMHCYNCLLINFQDKFIILTMFFLISELRKQMNTETRKTKQIFTEKMDQLSRLTRMSSPNDRGKTTKF